MAKHAVPDAVVRNADAAEKHGRLQPIIRHVHKILDWTLTGTEETALIVADTETSPLVSQTTGGVLSTLGVEPTILVVPQQEAPNLEPPNSVATAATATDAIVNLGTYPILHSEAIQGAIRQRDVRYLYLAGTTEDYFCRGAVEADPASLDDLTRRLHDRLRQADRVTVTCPHGTDVSFRIDGDRRHPFTGYPAGETPTCPVENTVNGTIVVDSYMMGVGLVSEPITWEVEDGWVTDITGGPSARRLREVLREYGDENARRIGEFSIMTNPCARPNGIYIEHLSVAGGTHFALGDGTSLGGAYASSIHLDGAQLEPTVSLDGTTVVERGSITFGQ